MNIYESLRSLILENVLLQQLKDKYVGEEKPVSQETFEKIEQVCKNKFYLIQWLTKKVGTFIIKDEDIYKYEEYFEIFEKNKNKFPYTDINQVKTADDVQEFIRKCVEIREGNIRFEDQELGGNYLSKNEIEKLEKGGGSKYLGMFENYQVFQISSPSEENWKVYRDLLGRCKGRDQGASIEICTIANYGYFTSYLKDYRKSSYFVLYDLNDPKSPYQLHVESGQFMDKDDDSEIKINKLKFYDWLNEKTEKYTKKFIYNTLRKEGEELPVEGKGYMDEKGKQGLWQKRRYGLVKTTYKDNEKNGFRIIYHDNGRIYQKEFYVNDERNGPYFEYDEDGKLNEKGEYKDGNEVGVWYYSSSYMLSDKSYRLVDHDKNEVEFYSTDGDLEQKITGKNAISRLGNVELYHPNGVLKAKGKLGKSGKLGKWEFYNEKGKLIAEGQYRRGNREGLFKFYFTEIVKTKTGNKRMNLVYHVNFSNRTVQPFTVDGKKLGPPTGFYEDASERILNKIGYWGRKDDLTAPDLRHR